MKPLLTVIIPVYNRADRLPHTLASLQVAQQIPLSLILVDNGSTDGSFKICQDFAAHHASSSFDIQVLEEPRRGASCARNLGLSYCQTKWVYFFDSDDIISPDFFSDIRQYIMQYGQELDVLAFPVQQVVDGVKSVRAYRPTPRPEVHILNSMLCTVAAVYSTEWLRAQGGWDEHLTTWDDWELGTRVLMAKPRMRWFEETAYHQLFVHTESQTGGSFSATLPATLQAMQTVLGNVQKNNHITTKERHRLLKALYYRAYIMAGKLAREGHLEGMKAYVRLARECLIIPNRWQQLIGKVLKRYTQQGGRGAWRIALWVC